MRLVLPSYPGSCLLLEPNHAISPFTARFQEHLRLKLHAQRRDFTIEVSFENSSAFIQRLEENLLTTFDPAIICRASLSTFISDIALTMNPLCDIVSAGI